MRFTRLEFLGLLLGWSVAFAGEGEGGGEGGGGEGKGAAPPREQREYTEKSNKMNALSGKIEEAAKRFEELAKEKGGSREDREARRKELVEVARQREKDSSEFARLKTEIAQRYPNHGEHGRAKGEGAEHEGKEGHEGHMGPEESRAEEAAPGLDGILKETKAAIDRTYAPFRDPKSDLSEKRAPASVESKTAGPRLRLER